jgi:hypothetical protein
MVDSNTIRTFKIKNLDNDGFVDVEMTILDRIKLRCLENIELAILRTLK